ALRAAAGHLGRVDAHARPHPRPGLVADVLRRLPGHALRGHQPGLVRARGPDPVRAGGVVPGQPHRPRTRPCGDLAGPVPDHALQQAWRQLPDRAVSVRPGRRGADRHRLRAGLAQPAQRHADPARGPHRPHLRGDHERARARRRLRRAARLPPLHRARVQDRDARARLVLQPVGDRPDRGARAAGLRDRGRGDEGDPADRRDLAVRVLRRLVHRGQLHPARAAAADLGPRAEGPGSVNTPITRLFGLVVLLFAVLVFATSWRTEFGAQRLRDNPLNRRQLLEDAKVKRGRILADDGSILARSVKAQGDTYTRIYPSNIFSHEVGYSFT